MTFPYTHKTQDTINLALI